MIFETLNRKKHLYMYAFSILYSKCISIPKFSYLSYQYTTFIVLYIADDVRLIVLDIFVYPYPTCVIFFFFQNSLHLCAVYCHLHIPCPCPCFIDH